MVTSRAPSRNALSQATSQSIVDHNPSADLRCPAGVVFWALCSIRGHNYLLPKTQQPWISKMQVHEAVRAAKQYLQNIFQDEPIADVGLEEVQFDSANKIWKVTLGFFRNWHADQKGAPSNLISALASQLAQRDRSFKVVTIDDVTGEALSLLNRELVS